MIRTDLLIEVCTAMATTLDRPANPPPPPRPDRHSEFSTASRPPALPPAPPERRTNWLHRYQSHLLVAGISVIATAIAVSPLIIGATSRPTSSTAPAQTTIAPTNLSTNVTITASEFKFSPNSIQVPLGQKVTFTLDN